MSLANYEASICNHGEILICVQAAGNLHDADLEAALAKIKRHSKLIIADAGRTINFRFELNSSPENSKWGFFQPHRRVMGLLVLAGCTTPMDVALLHETFQKRKEAFSNFIFDARCFVFGIENALYPQQSKAEIFQFMDVQSWKLSDRDIKEFLTSVFYVLESKRLQMAADKSDRPPLLTTPFEKSQTSTTDSDSRSFRKKSLGRWKKHLADVSLLSGMKMEALQNYHTSLDLLVSANDQVWIGGVLEGLCVASAMVMYGETKSLPKPPASKFTSKQVLDPKNLLSSKLAGAPTNADLLKFCVQAPDDFVDRYKEAVINYSRSEHMGIIELEACIKATKVMAIMSKSMQAAEFLQNAVYIALKVSDEERITKYSVLADLYAEINFHRKSAFYRRVAAMQCVAPHLDHPDWKKCYRLLKGTLEGYNLQLHTDSGLPLALTEQQAEFGWPQVRLRVLFELVFSSKRNGGQKIANRYMAYLLMRLHTHLTESEEKEACSTLQSSSNKREDFDKFSDDMVLPSIHLYNLPIVCDATPKPLPENLQPAILSTVPSQHSVFLFTPSTYQSVKKKLDHIDFKWSVSTPAEVCVRVQNPLRVHTMQVSHFKLLCEMNKSTDKNAYIDCHKISLEIPPKTTMETSLVLIPKSVGSVVITGYEICVFGIKSRCLFRNMPWIPVDAFEIDITPEAPVLQRDPRYLSRTRTKKSTKLDITVYPGETRMLKLPFDNTSNVPVTHLDVQITPPTSELPKVNAGSKSLKKSKVNWLSMACEEVTENLPLSPLKTLHLPLSMTSTGTNQDLLNDPQTCTCQIKLKYCGAETKEQNFCRNSVVEVIATLKMCINIISITVTCADIQGWCRVSVEISNVSEQKAFVYSTASPATTVVDEKKEESFKKINDFPVLAELDPDDMTTLTFNIETIVLQGLLQEDIVTTNDSESKLQREKSRLQQMLSDNLALKWMTEDEMFSLDVLEAFRDPMAREVTGFSRTHGFVWATKDGVKRRGLLDISRFPIDQDSRVNLVRPSLYWGISIEDVNVTATRLHKTAVGEACPITITITNISDCNISTVDLELEIFQDQNNGFREWNMADCALCVGCQSQSFHEIKPGDSVKFECNIIFLLAGNYHIRLHRTNDLEDSGMVGLFSGELVRTLSNQPNHELFSYREFSPHVIIEAEFL